MEAVDYSQIYEVLSSDSPEQMFEMDSGAGSVIGALKQYFKQLIESKAAPLSLSLCLGYRKIELWAVIADDDEKNENALIMAEAHASAIYYPVGVVFDTMIVEESDNIAIPVDYKPVNLKILQA